MLWSRSSRKSRKQAQFEQGLQRFVVRTGRGFSWPVGPRRSAGSPSASATLSEAAGINAVLRSSVRLAAEHFCEVFLRKPEREPSRLHELIELVVRGAARHGLVPTLRLRNTGTLGRDTFLKPANLPIRARNIRTASQSAIRNAGAHRRAPPSSQSRGIQIFLSSFYCCQRWSSLCNQKMSDVRDPTWMCPDAPGPSLHDPSHVDLRRRTGTSMNAPMPAEGAETGKRHRFAVRPNPRSWPSSSARKSRGRKLRDAIVDGMSRAQTRPN